MSGTDLLNYFNYAIIAIIALGALGGFLKGTYKSTYHIITSFIIIIIGWLASDKIIDFILTFDLSSYNIAIPIGETVINLTTLEETIAVFLAGFLGVEAETVVTLELYLFAMAVIKFPLKLVFILLLLLLNVTVFKFIFWIVWLFIKPKKHVTKNEKGRKVKEKVKLSLLSRTGGAAVGVVHSLIGLLILIVPISALCSLGTKMSPVFDMVMPNEESSEQVTLTIGEDGKLYKFNGGMDLGIDMSMLAPYVEFMEKYDEETYFFLISKLLNGYPKGHVNEVPNGWSSRKKAFDTLKNEFKYDKKVCKEVEEDFPVNNTEWHDPLDVMQICAYSFNGMFDPYNATFHYRSTTRSHQGVDLFSIPNTPVYACLDGRIAFAGVQKGYGNVIILAIEEPSQVEIFKNRRKSDFKSFYTNHGELELMDGSNFNIEASTLYLAYAHLSSFNIIKGDFVKCGDVIGFSGETGNAKGTKGPHVHFEVRSKLSSGGINNRCNPALYFDYEQYKEAISEKDVKVIKLKNTNGLEKEDIEKISFESENNVQYKYMKNKK